MVMFLYTRPSSPSAYYVSDLISTYRWVVTSGDKSRNDAAGIKTLSAPPSWVADLTLVGVAP